MRALSSDIDTHAQGLKKLVYVAKEDPTKVTAYHDGLLSEIEKAGESKARARQKMAFASLL